MSSSSLKQEEAADSFRLYPNGGKDHFEVLVFKNRAVMRRHAYEKLRKEKRDSNADRFDAIFFPEADVMGVPKGNLVGHLLFARNILTFGYVVHELAHAVLEWFRVSGRDPMNDLSREQEDSHEEQFAMALQAVTEQFLRKCPLEEE